MAVKYRANVTAASIGLFCFSLILTAFSARHPEFSRLGAGIITELMSPVLVVNNSVGGSLSGMKQNYLLLSSAHEENKKLKDRLAALETLNSKLMEVRSQNERLEKLLQMKDQEQLTGVTGEIIGFDPSNWVRGITIDKGTLDGVNSGMPVVSGNGIVGQVTVASLNTAKVLLITDHASGVDALVQSTRLRGVVEGRGGDKCLLKYVLREDELLVGERIISSGMDGIYPKGLLIGTVSNSKRQTRGMFQSVVIEPAVNFAKLESVYVITSYSDRDRLEAQAAEEQRVLASGETPTPTAAASPTAAPGASASPKPKAPTAALKPLKTPPPKTTTSGSPLPSAIGSPKAVATKVPVPPKPSTSATGLPKTTPNPKSAASTKPTAAPKPVPAAIPTSISSPTAEEEHR